MMKRLGLLGLALVWVGAASAQMLTLSVPTPSYKPGDQFTLSVALEGGKSAASAIEFSVSVPSGWTYTPSIGASATGAAKQLVCSVSTTAPKLLCLVVGLNQTTIPDGVLATLTTTVPSTQGAGILSIALADTNSSDPSGTGLPLVAASPLSLPIVIPPVISKCDLNGDGSTNQTDVQIAEDQALGKAPVGNADLDGDGNVTALDVQRIINASQGLSCRVGP